MSNLDTVLNSAKYNEVVTLQQESGEEVNLVQVIDRQNGGLIWQPLPNKEMALNRHLQTKTWLYPMLNDTARNNKYEEAIKKACLKLEDRNANGESVVLDIGSGTGLLALMVDRYAPSDVSNIISIEMASSMATLATLHVEENKKTSVYDRIKIVEGHSCNDDFVLPQKAKMCTSELLESGLLNEGIIPAMRDAWNRHLEGNAICVPCGARVYAQLIEGGNSVADFARFQSRNNSLVCLTTKKKNEKDYPRKGDKVIHIHASKLLEFESLKVLTEPKEVFSFDFSHRDMIPPSKGRRREICFEANTSGEIQAVLFWWELDLDRDIIYSTKSDHDGQQNWQDHWLQNLYVFGPCDFKRVSQYQKINVIASHDDFSISFQHQTTELMQTIQNSESFENCMLVSKFSSQRIKQLNDEERMSFYEESIKGALKHHAEGVSIIDLSDFSLCAVIAAKLGAKATSLESSSGEIPLLSAHMAQVGNELTDGNAFQILNVYAEQLTNQYVFEGSAQIVMSEPYYEKLEGFPIVESLNYFYQVKNLKERGIVVSYAESIPARGRIYACAIESSNLRSAYRYLDGKCNGFSHFAIDKSRGDVLEIYVPLWQYDYNILSKSYQVACFEYSGSPTGSYGKWECINISHTGRFDAMVLWVEYESSAQRKYKTFNNFHNQFVHFLPKSIRVKEGDVIKCMFDLDFVVEEKLRDFVFHVELENITSSLA